LKKFLHGKRSRKAISYALVVLLVTMASLAISGVVIGALTRVGTATAKQPVLTVVGQPTIQKVGSNYELYIAVSNTGSAAAEIKGVVVGGVKVTDLTGLSIAPGETKTFIISLGTTDPSGGESYAIVEGTLFTTGGTIAFTAYCQY